MKHCWLGRVDQNHRGSIIAYITNKSMKKISVYITPNAKKSEVIGEIVDLFGGKTLKVKVAAPPLEGKANKELINILSEYFDVPKSKISIIVGEKSRNKIVEIKE